MSLDITSAMKMLNEGNGISTYPVYVPSLKRNIMFKTLTVGEQKTLSKEAIENEDGFYVCLCAVIAKLSTEELDFNVLNEIDKTSILAGIKKNNFVGNEVLNIICAKCSQKFTIDYDPIVHISKFLKVEIPRSFFEISSNGKVFKFDLSLPSINFVVMFRTYMNALKERAKFELKDDKEQFEIMMANVSEYLSKYQDFTYVRKIFIDGQEIDGFDSADIPTRDELIDALPVTVMGALQKKIKETFEPLFEGMSQEITCPYCKDKIVDTINMDGFFYI